jgi:curved DNA-binding protein CbpA
MNAEGVDLYEVLDISPQASEDDVKRAYFRLVKLHRPDQDPEGFERVRRAYEILSNPETRKAYDVARRHGDDIARLLNKAEDLMDKEQWAAAITPLKNILNLWAEAEMALFYLGVCYQKLGRWAEACSTFQRLTILKPDIGAYWNELGASFHQRYVDLKEAGKNDLELLSSARECYQQAIEKEPFNAQSHILMAYTYLEEGAFTEAQLWVEKAISADNKLDVNDIEPLLLLCVICATTGEVLRLSSAVSRIERLADEFSADIRSYAGYSLVQEAVEFIKVQQMLPARYLISAAVRLVPNDPKLRELHEAFEQPPKTPSPSGGDTTGCALLALVIVGGIIGLTTGYLPGMLAGAWLAGKLARAFFGETI